MEQVREKEYNKLVLIKNQMKKIKLEDLGYTPFFASNRNKLSLDNFAVARVIAEY